MAPPPLFLSASEEAPYTTADSGFAYLLHCIESAGLYSLPKIERRRAERWIEKLHGPSGGAPPCNAAWAKNRNEYAALLVDAIDRRDFRDPFHRGPPDGALGNLAPHLRIRIPRGLARRIGGAAALVDDAKIMRGEQGFTSARSPSRSCRDSPSRQRASCEPCLSCQKLSQRLDEQVEQVEKLSAKLQEVRSFEVANVAGSLSRQVRGRGSGHDRAIAMRSRPEDEYFQYLDEFVTSAQQLAAAVRATCP
jgi:hypothetical protein